MYQQLETCCVLSRYCCCLRRLVLSMCGRRGRCRCCGCCCGCCGCCWMLWLWAGSDSLRRTRNRNHVISLRVGSNDLNDNHTWTTPNGEGSSSSRWYVFFYLFFFFITLMFFFRFAYCVSSGRSSRRDTSRAAGMFFSFYLSITLNFFRFPLHIGAAVQQQHQQQRRQQQQHQQGSRCDTSRAAGMFFFSFYYLLH